jgi:hypothetical protein
MEAPLHPSKDPEWQARKASDPKLVDRIYAEFMGLVEECDAMYAAPTHALDAAERERIEREMQQFQLAFCRGLEDQLRTHGIRVMRMSWRQDLWRIRLRDRDNRPYEVSVSIDEATELMDLHGSSGGQKLLDLTIRRVFDAREKYIARMS